MDKSSAAFALSLTEAQPAIYACIYAVLPNRGIAHDLLQETNLTLLRKADDFEPVTNFNAWATRIARYHVLNHRRKMNRDRLVFDEALIEELCSRQVERDDDLCRYTEAKRCGVICRNYPLRSGNCWNRGIRRAVPSPNWPTRRVRASVRFRNFCIGYANH